MQTKFIYSKLQLNDKSLSSRFLPPSPTASFYHIRLSLSSNTHPSLCDLFVCTFSLVILLSFPFPLHPLFWGIFFSFFFLVVRWVF